MHMKRIKIIAHRGVPALTPENTLASFRKAKELGAKAIELDVHVSSDGAIVVHHDYALGYSDGSSSLIRNEKAASIRKIDAGNWFSPEFAGEKIPFLDEVFSEFGDSLEYELELKGSTIEFLKKVLDMVINHRLFDRVEFTSPHLPLLCRLTEHYPQAKCGVFFSAYPEWMDVALGEEVMLDTMLLVRASVAHLPLSVITTRVVEKLHSQKYLVHAVDCNTEVEIQSALSLGCDQFSTNELQLAQRVINS